MPSMCSQADIIQPSLPGLGPTQQGKWDAETSQTKFYEKQIMEKTKINKQNKRETKKIEKQNLKKKKTMQKCVNSAV